MNDFKDITLFWTGEPRVSDEMYFVQKSRKIDFLSEELVEKYLVLLILI